jgi:hypothetical protein
MSDAYGDPSLPSEVERLRSTLLAALDTPVPAATDDEVGLLERTLRARLADHIDRDGNLTDPPLTAATADDYIRILREVADPMIARRRSTDSPSAACHDAAVIGVVLISACTGINPALGVAAFVVSVGYAVEACVF